MTWQRRTAAAAAALLLASVGPEVSAAQPARLKVQAGYGLAVPVLGEMIRHFEQTLARNPSAGLRMRVYDVEKLVPTLQIFDAVRAGRIDAGFSWPGYWMGKLPAVAVFAAVPFGPEPPDYLAWIHHGGGLELWRKLYADQGVVPVPCGVIPPEASGWFRQPIETVEDLKGLKIRYAGLGGEVLRRLGASITLLAAGDIFLALERGVIDATEYSMPAVDRPLGFYKVAKHYYFPGWHQPASNLELIVNRKKWESLSDAQRAALETACDATTLWGLTRGVAVQGEALAWFESQGVTLHRWSPALMRAFRAAADEVMREQAAADPAFAEAWASLRAFLEESRSWSELALPE